MDNVNSTMASGGAMLSDEQASGSWNLKTMLLVAGLTCLFLTSVSKEILNIHNVFFAKTIKKRFEEPPMLPLRLPFLGHSLMFTWDVTNFSSTLKRLFPKVPIQIDLTLIKPIILFNPDDIIQVFKRSDIFSNSPYRIFVNNTFEVPEELEEYYTSDKSQRSKNDREDLKDEHRVKYLMHKFITQFMGGPNLLHMGERFRENLVSQFRNQQVGSEWKALDDLYDLVKTQMFRASVDAMFGEQLFKMHPDFAEQFWAFEKQVPDLSKGLPKFMVKKATNARERCLQSVMEWNKYLEDFTEAQSPRQFTHYDPVLGSEVIQRRHAAFKEMPAMTDRAKACDDLGLLWASTANAIHSAFWLTFELCRHPEDLRRVREEIKSSELPVSDGFKTYDMVKLAGSDLLQSMYAETLRLYVAMIVMRSPQEDFKLRDWTLKAGKTVSLFTYAQHRDTTVFSNDDEHPINDFWADRFMVQEGSDSKPTFSLQGYEGSWIPYGGGSHLCPGRQFAKQEMLLAVAVLLGNFEVELTGPEVKVDWSYYGTGAMAVKGLQKCRIRRL